MTIIKLAVGIFVVGTIILLVIVAAAALLSLAFCRQDYQLPGDL